MAYTMHLTQSKIYHRRRYKLKRIFIVLAALALMITGSSLANAALLIDPLDPTDFMVNNSYSYQHNIRNEGFVPGQDLVTSFSLQVFLKDDNDTALESAYVSLPITGGLYNFTYTSNTFGWTLGGLLELNLAGLLDVTITRLWGDFYFDKSILTANGSGGTPVPESSTLVLLGCGLLGLVGYGRRMLKK